MPDYVDQWLSRCRRIWPALYGGHDGVEAIVGMFRYFERGFFFFGPDGFKCGRRSSEVFGVQAVSHSSLALSQGVQVLTTLSIQLDPKY
jgi:hypothetical protein